MMIHNGSVASMWMARLSLSLRWVERSVYKHPICSEFPSLEIIKTSPRAGQLMVIVFVS